MRIASIVPALLLLAGNAGPAPASDGVDIPEAAKHVAAATRLAGDDLKAPLFLCRPDGGKVVGHALVEGIKHWQEPIKLFDNLYFIGNGFIGTYILKTSDGLILFDALMGDEVIRDVVAPGLIKLGLDPKDIKYAVVTHGHWEHYAGGPYLQRVYGTRVGLSAADWDYAAKRPVDQPDIAHHAPPKRDWVIEDGEKLTLGDTTISLYITPGHSAGTVSAIIPVRDKGETRYFSLLGGTAIPPRLEPKELPGGIRSGGIDPFIASVDRLGKLAGEAGAVGILNTHAFGDGGLDRIEAARAKGDGSPLLIGQDAVQRYYALFGECLRAARARAIVNPPAPDRIF